MQPEKLTAESIFFAALAGALIGVAALAINYYVHAKAKPALKNV